MRRISDNRHTGIARRDFKMFRELCRDSTFKNIVLVTNMWGLVSKEVGEAREEELTAAFFKQVLDKGAQLVRHQNTAQSAHDIVRRILKNQPMSVNEAFYMEIQRHQAELKALREEMFQVLKERDEGIRRDFDAETRHFQERMKMETRHLQERMEMELGWMTSNHEEEKRRMEAEIRRVQEEARVERELLLARLS
jgi:hypothetical protein